MWPLWHALAMAHVLVDEYPRRITQLQFNESSALLWYVEYMKSLLTDQKGVSAIEFGLIGPVFIAIVMGGIEFGSIMYTHAAVEFVTNDVARQLATNRITQTQAQSAIPTRLPRWAQSAATVTVTASSATPTSNLYTITTSVPLANATPSTFFAAIYASRSMKITATMQQEPTS
jgi:Flp pilus assembly protein TadG